MSYKKDFDGWNTFAKNIDAKNQIPFFKNREVWWIALGINIGYEEDGKGLNYSRPVLILYKLGKYTFIGIPLSTTLKSKKFYLKFSFVDGVISSALLGHIRAFDSRRLIRKYGMVDKGTFEYIRKSAKDML